jgi:hypothetical protein
MLVAGEFAQLTLEQIKELCAGGTLTVYSVARPISPERAVDRSGLLATFTFQTPAFGAPKEGLETPLFVEDKVPGHSVGTPGFARIRKADGTTIADLSAGPGPREVKFAEISCTHGAPVKVAKFHFQPEGGWPERPDYYDTRPRPGFPLPKAPD